jgi:hypothetical protein
MSQREKRGQFIGSNYQSERVPAQGGVAATGVAKEITPPAHLSCVESRERVIEKN